jgi:hypothetical protein
MQKYSCYNYDVYTDAGKWVYRIFDPYYKASSQTVLRESSEWYEDDKEAEFAAINHIDLLENGDG